MTEGNHHNLEIRPLGDFFETIEAGLLQQHEHLAILPLLTFGEAGAVPPAFVSLAEALAAGSFTVDEVSEHGSVPKIRARNSGNVAVLVLFGEELVGAKQNRVANASFLVVAHSNVDLDVSCVEAGRWGRRPGERFEESHEVVSSELRKKMAHSVKTSRDRSGGFNADQGEVWNEVADRMQRSRVHSPTGAYADYSENWKGHVDTASRTFDVVERQVGFVALRPAAGERPARVLGVEAVGRPDAFAKAFPKLLRSYVVDSVDAGLRKDTDRARAATPGFTDPVAFLREISDADFRLSRSLGGGQDLRLDGEVVSGCALLRGGVVHLTAFPFERPGRSGGRPRTDRIRPEVRGEVEQSQRRAAFGLDEQLRRVRERRRALEEEE